MSDYLSEDLIVEIFTRRPIKSLLQFRSVSKSLRSCIGSPNFIRMHTSRSQQRLLFIHGPKGYIPGDEFYTLHAADQLPLCPISGYNGIPAVKFPRISIVGPCNGILCQYDYKKYTITLWNPSIMRQLTLPDCPRQCSYGAGIGIGFDPVSDDNKIVSIPINGGILESSYVYEMKTHAWCPIASPMPLYSKVFSRSCYLNGVLHWVVGDAELCYIMTLDLTTRVFGTIALPKPDWRTLQLTIIQGSLSVISTSTDFDTWIWLRRDASWSVIYKSKTNQLEYGVQNAFELTNSGDLLLHTFVEGSHVYNPKTGAVSKLVDLSGCLFDMNTYVESLHLLDMGAACEVKPANIFFERKKEKRRRFSYY